MIRFLLTILAGVLLGGVVHLVSVLAMPRIAVDKDARVHQLGPSLFRDALERAEAMSQHSGVKAFLVYALDDRSR